MRTASRTLLAVALGAGLLRAGDLTGPVVTSLTIFAGTADGLYRTTDWGGTWKRIPGAIAGDHVDKVGAVRDIWVLPEVVLFASDGGAYASRDSGEQWKKMGVTGPANCVMPSWVPTADSTVFVCTPSGLLKSLNGGYTFTPTPLDGIPVRRLAWPGPDLVAATPGGVVLSENAAVSFRPLGKGLPPGEVTAIATSSHYIADPVLFAAVGTEGLFRSGDAGRTWALVGLRGRSISDLEWVGIQLFAVTDQGVVLSEDVGQTWQGPFPAALAGHEAPIPGPLLFPQSPASTVEAFLGTGSGVFRSMDGARTWTPSGLEGQRVLALATYPPPPSLPARAKRR